MGSCVERIIPAKLNAKQSAFQMPLSTRMSLKIYYKKKTCICGKCSWKFNAYNIHDKALLRTFQVSILVKSCACVFLLWVHCQTIPGTWGLIGDWVAPQGLTKGNEGFLNGGTPKGMVYNGKSYKNAGHISWLIPATNFPQASCSLSPKNVAAARNDFSFFFVSIFCQIWVNHGMNIHRIRKVWANFFRLNNELCFFDFAPQKLGGGACKGPAAWNVLIIAFCCSRRKTPSFCMFGSVTLRFGCPFRAVKVLNIPHVWSFR